MPRKRKIIVHEEKKILRHPLNYQSVFSLTFVGCVLASVGRDVPIAAATWFKCLPENLASAGLLHLLPGQESSKKLLVFK